MREIKFRAWDKETKSMSLPHSLEALCIMKDALADFAIIGNKLEFMQYTGLKSKNDKEIYEGDIVQLARDDRPEIRAIIKWDNRGAWMYDCIINPWPHENEYLLSIPPELNYVVIGNIYENPELLEEQCNQQES